ncbi:DUF6476 family protein [Pseudopelagicola sp. nBUS_20]|uniref:DUF6476 family protein n=1 Tax=Pseudopelagicola sp. nBUS_20 TaxID=3395317 RepID=UPI003EB8A734
MDQSPEPVEPANLKLLRLLVTGLTAVMIVGLVIIVALIVIQFRDTGPVLPEDIILPNGVSALAATAAESWYAIVTDDDRILIYDRITGALRQEISVQQE